MLNTARLIVAYRASESEFSRYALISLLRKRRKSKMQIAQPFDPTCHSRDFIRNGNRFDENRSTDLSFRFPFNGTYIQDTPDPRSPSASSRPEASRIASPFRKSLLVSRIAFSEEGRTERTMRALMGKHKEPHDVEEATAR